MGLRVRVLCRVAGGASAIVFCVRVVRVGVDASGCLVRGRPRRVGDVGVAIASVVCVGIIGVRVGVGSVAGATRVGEGIRGAGAGGATAAAAAAACCCSPVAMSAVSYW